MKAFVIKISIIYQDTNVFLCDVSNLASKTVEVADEGHLRSMVDRKTWTVEPHKMEIFEARFPFSFKII